MTDDPTFLKGFYGLGLAIFCALALISYRAIGTPTFIFTIPFYGIVLVGFISVYSIERQVNSW